MSIVTKTGDKGTTGLFSGERVAKDDLRVEAYGTLDELSSQLGVARHSARLETTLEAIEAVQRSIYRAAAELASPSLIPAQPFTEEDCEALTAQISDLEEAIPLGGFVLPGMTPASAALDVSRTVCRRAERRIVALSHEAPVSPQLQAWINRLADWLFMLARQEEVAAGKLTFVK
ncbi:MAG: cob(I)yrinic acid a,c-diamide adenosyltransferase [Rectinemataceae bacterium]